MTVRRSFLLRMDPAVLDAVQRWANDDLRSLNGQIEFLLRAALRQAGREPSGPVPAPAGRPRREGEAPTPAEQPSKPHAP